MAAGREDRARLRRLEPRPGSRLARLIARVAGDSYAVELRDLLDEYSEIGGDLLSAALALRALVGFLVTLLLLAVGVGVLSDDPTVRAAIVERASALVPGLEAPVQSMLHELSSGRATYSTLALLGLAWTTGGVYGALDDALRRVFPGGRPRGIVERRVRGTLAVALIFGSVVILLVLGAAWSAVEGHLLAADVTVWRVANPIIGAVITSGVVLLVYRLVPTAPPSMREAGLPALVKFPGEDETGYRALRGGCECPRSSLGGTPIRTDCRGGTTTRRALTSCSWPRRADGRRTRRPSVTVRPRSSDTDAGPSAAGRTANRSRPSVPSWAAVERRSFVGGRGSMPAGSMPFAIDHGSAGAAICRRRSSASSSPSAC